jgi:hypothetical protein
LRSHDDRHMHVFSKQIEFCHWEKADYSSRNKQTLARSKKRKMLFYAMKFAFLLVKYSCTSE